MAPKPIEDIDFPALSDIVLEFLRAIWDTICNVCLVIWSYISEAFMSVWTYPPFETFRNELVAALTALLDYVAAHPITFTAIVILVLVVVPAVCRLLVVMVCNLLLVVLVCCLGPRELVVLRDSDAANYQSTGYGGNVQRDSTCAHFQSVEAKGGGGYRAVGSSGSPSWH